MTTSEPTTGEIVRALRCDGDANNCIDCRYATYDTATILCDQEQNVRDAADRLESQERTIADKDAKIAELTACAEQAEAREKAAVKDMWLMRSCQSCKHKPEGYPHIRCACTDCDDEDKWGWRGLPQDGEGK